ncbi:uncharacterized protein SRS1_11772 [Sporisorium reilianum f. sp. reilianum]|uniref:Uncharacterized protein n=1 Tax=Sporisorium reilianum f. sp. reilianum TaxID=72559 RepID=A0A2N8U836_9BASI|nr:uncharacterized protein SRS1_11772 [Sporisorium reilianum f. sp. reilianum]
MVLTVARSAASRYAASTATVRRTFCTSSSHASLSSLFSWVSGKSSSSAPTNDAVAGATSIAGSVSQHVASSAPPPSTSSTPPPPPSSIAPPLATSSIPPNTSAKPTPPMQGKMLARDQELLSKLLDREGGSAGVSIVNGRYEEGLGPETKKNMFRLI